MSAIGEIFVLQTDRVTLRYRFDVRTSVPCDAAPLVRIRRCDEVPRSDWQRYRKWLASMGKRLARKTGKTVQIEYSHPWNGEYVMTVPYFGEAHTVHWNFDCPWISPWLK